MNKKKANGYARLLVVFLVAIILIFAVGIVADGWQQNNQQTPSDDNDKIADESEKVDENKNQNDTNNPGEPENEPQKPKYFNYLTGLETSKNLSEKRHTAFIFDSSSPLYGISYSDILIEIPIEDGRTRLVSFINDYNNLGKIGSITKKRDYISRVAEFFGGLVLSMGEDGDAVTNNSSYIDLSTLNAYYYTEYNLFNYTNENLLKGALAISGVSEEKETKYSLPYLFNKSSDNNISLDKSAVTVTLPFSEVFTSELSYSNIEGKYAFLKNGALKNDLLNSEICYFDNCIVLFSDTVTYEYEDRSEIQFKTEGSGKGFYFTKGTYTEITYKVSDDGLSFLDENGEKLQINRGKSYIGYLKSSQLESFKNSLS